MYMLNSGHQVSEYKFQSGNYIRFRTNTLEKGMNPLIPHIYGLNSITTVLLLLHINPQRLICNQNKESEPTTPVSYETRIIAKDLVFEIYLSSLNPWRSFNTKSSLYICFKYIWFAQHILQMTFLNEPELIVWIEVKWFQELLCKTNNLN